MAKKKKSVKSNDNNFLVEHGEKLVFGGACALIALFVWMGLRSPAYEETSPGDLYETAAVEAQTYINNPNSWDKLDESREADLWASERIANNEGRMDPSVYLFGPFSGAAIETLAKRADPEFLPPQKFEVEFVRTQIATKVPENAGKERTKMIALNGLPTDEDVGLTGGMKYWLWAYRPGKSNLKEDTHLAMTYDLVAGIGLIPYEEQSEKYREKFRYAEGWHAIRDKPLYKYLQIQRSEDGGQTWVDFNDQIDKYLDFFAAPAKEVIKSDYIVEGVTDEIPPLLSFDYREVAGHSEVPFERFIENEEVEEVTDEQDSKSSMFDEKEKVEEPKDENDKKVLDRAKYRLARFFDPTPKEVGKTYQYRVRGWVIDPNSLDLEGQVEKKEGGREIAAGGGEAGGAGKIDDSGGASNAADEAKRKNDGLTDEEREALEVEPVPIRETMLAKSVRDRQAKKRDDIPAGKEFLEGMIPTPWSEVSEVTIPRNYARFYAGPVKAATQLTSADGITYSQEEQEDTAEMIAVSSTETLDVSIPVKNDKVFRGSMLNFNTIAKFLHPITWDVKELNEYVGTGIDPTEDKRTKIYGKFFQTDAIVLDLMGGEKMPFSNSNSGLFTMPGEMIVMDSTGRLIVRNELDDATNFRISTFAGDDPEPDAERKRREAERDADRDKGDEDGGLDSGGR